MVEAFRRRCAGRTESVQAETHVTEKPGLAALCIQVGVAAEEGVEGGQLVPPRLQLRINIPKEATHIRTWHHTLMFGIWYALVHALRTPKDRCI